MWVSLPIAIVEPNWIGREMAKQQDEYLKAISELKKVGDWTLKELLGQGAFNWVIAAQKASVDGSKIKGAIKLAKPSTSRDTFVHEFKTLQRIDSPYIPKVLDSGIAGVLLNKTEWQFPWFAIEIIKADTLEEEVEQHGILHKQEWLELAHDLLCAVSATHEAGIIHLDIKPDQILRHSRRSILVDFGNSTMANVLDDGAIGISHYMYASPEQVNPNQDQEDLGYESDIFNVGSTLVYAGTGVPPWDPPPRSGNIRNFKGSLLTRMTTIPPRTDGLDDEQKRIIDLMLQTNPANRTSAADALDLIRTMLPTGSSRKNSDYKFKNMRSVPQKLTINQKLDKVIAKQNAALAVEEAKRELLKDPSYVKVQLNEGKSDSSRSDVRVKVQVKKSSEAKDILLNRGDNWWTGLRATIWLGLTTGPIGTGIRFYFLEGKGYEKTYAQLDRNLAAFLFSLFTFGLATPFVAIERFRRSKNSVYLKRLVASVSAIIGFVAVPAIGNVIGVDSPYYWIIATTWLVSGITHLVLIPVVAFKQPKVKSKTKSGTKEVSKAKPAKTKSDA
jgi:serine/threonine protein kinase